VLVGTTYAPSVACGIDPTVRAVATIGKCKQMRSLAGLQSVSYYEGHPWDLYQFAHLADLRFAARDHRSD
jgi:hypothetical protein